VQSLLTYEQDTASLLDSPALQMLAKSASHVLASDADRMQRFLREARATSPLNHPNVATIYDIGESEAG